MVGGLAAGDGTETVNGFGGDPSNDASDEPNDPSDDPGDEPSDADPAPKGIPTIQIEVSDADLAMLEADPFHADDVNGVFVDGTGTRYEGVDVSFRGAYALQNLINQGDRRNWKVKFKRAQRYRGRREWNLNYEPHFRQKLAYDLMELAGVKLTGARHVLLAVNGKPHGLYLEYEDPDDLDWLRDSFSDGTGDLYKAAYDLPDAADQRAFAELTYLGANDSDYLLHYNKKTNKDGALETDYSSIREFIYGLNSTPAEKIPAWLDERIEVAELLSYLVVTNFVSHWDGYPHRPKNFWMYENPASGKWSLIPWDMDATFQTTTFGLNQMGTTASAFYQFDGYEPYGRDADEGTERPLVRRMMEHAQFREAYVARYKEALATFLRQEALLQHLAELFALAQQYASAEDLNQLEWTRAEMERFIQQRWNHVNQELAE
jgi:spore coat protein CotH